MNNYLKLFNFVYFNHSTTLGLNAVQKLLGDHFGVSVEKIACVADTLHRLYRRFRVSTTRGPAATQARKNRESFRGRDHFGVFECRSRNCNRVQMITIEIVNNGNSSFNFA